jgi:UDP-glucose 4-epimerase
MQKTVLITGGLGFIGKHIAKKYRKENYYVMGIGHGVPILENNCFPFHEWYDASLTIDNLRRIHKMADLIIHCAGGSTVGISVEQPYLDYHKTVNSTLELLEFVRLNCNNTRLIYLSSAAVYGATKDELIKEYDIPNPVSPYGFHKLASENICKSYAVNFGVQVTILRLFSVYGNGLKKQLLWEAANKFANCKDKQVNFFGTGNETRDWLNIDDVTELVFTISRKVHTSFEIFNGCSGEKKMVKEVLTMLKEALGKHDIQIAFDGNSKPGDPYYYWGDTGKLKEINWNPKVSLRGGLRDYADWYKNLK